MQEKEKDSRTFPEIWATLTKGEKADASRQIIADGHTLSVQTINAWANGKWKPRTLASRNGIAASMTKALGISVTGRTLFPDDDNV